MVAESSGYPYLALAVVEVENQYLYVHQLAISLSTLRYTLSSIAINHTAQTPTSLHQEDASKIVRYKANSKIKNISF